MKKHFMNNTILLLFNDLLFDGGIQRYNRNLDKSLKSEFANYNFKKIILADGGKVRFIFKVILDVWRKQPKFTICSHINLAPLALLVKICFGIDYILLTHGIEVWQVKQGVKFFALSKALFVLTASKYSRNRMAANNININKIKVLPNTVDTDLFYPKPKNKILVNALGAGEKKIFLTVARLLKKERYKGHDIILDVLQDFSNDYLWVVAGEGDDLKRLKQKAERLGVIDKVCFAGKVSKERLVDYYNLCDLFIMPSKGEGFGIVFLEALACGKPVIAGNADGSREPLLNGELGFLVDPDNKKEIIRAINIIYKVKDKRVDPNYLRERVKENFGMEAFNRKTKEIFNQIL